MAKQSKADFANKRVLNHLNESLHKILDHDTRSIIIGEDILDPYGGAFKVTQGLSSRFPDRVITTPISEAGIVGLAIGFALKGYKPIVEIMFGDFVTLIADQLINQLSKMCWMYNEKLKLNLVIRTPMGGRRGYGPTHSQTLEKLFMGIPGLTIAAVSNVFDPGLILKRATLTTNSPVFLVENKLLYTEFLLTEKQLVKQYGLNLSVDEADFPTITLFHNHEPDITLITYGGMVPLVLEAVERLHQEEDLDCAIVVPHCLSPLNIDPLSESAMISRRIVVVEEGISAWGWGAEVVAALSNIALESPPQRVGAAMTPIPAARTLENQTLPQVQDIYDAVIRTIDKTFA